MADNIQDFAKTDYVAGTPDYVLTTYDHVQNVLGSPKYSQQLPFYISMVDGAGDLKSLGLPPIDNQGTKPLNSIMAVRLLVNPASMVVNMSKLVNRTQTMTGWVEDHWGDELDTISCQGNTAGFVTGKNLLSPTQDGIDQDSARKQFYANVGTSDYYSYMDSGLTARDRRSTVSYREFKKLIALFQANGCIYDGQGFVKNRYYIQVNYDYSQYIGYFESFDIMEEASNPFRFNYTLTFKAEKTAYSFSKSRN